MIECGSGDADSAWLGHSLYPLAAAADVSIARMTSTAFCANG
ncbi:hypothetical protein X742_33615 [Mesorhizobium sp. LNHC232B00]|nr:hypothetical protein X742_33615 [Mesorhizobium sp. LNHC232B00]